MFIVSAAIIGFFGIRMTYLARDLAVATGLGEALMGAVFIGATTSLSGIIASATAAWEGQASLAVSNSLGGIAAQTLFLVLGDAVYRKANLEYAAASVENMMMSVQLMIMLSVLAIAFTLPQNTLFHVHPASPLLILGYLFTLKLLVDTHERPMWLPRRTQDTVTEERALAHGRGRKELGPLLLQFLLCALAVGFAGWLIAGSGMAIVNKTGFSAGIVGGIFIAIATSLPELVVAVTAIRVGALTLAVGDIVGGNAFDTLFIAVADMVYRQGSIYAAIDNTERVWLGSAMLMNAILLMGLMYRERKGIGNIGMESALILLVYISTVTYLTMLT
jgi:cation:H+ antiporter